MVTCRYLWASEKDEASAILGWDGKFDDRLHPPQKGVKLRCLVIPFRCVYQKALSLEGFPLPCAVRPCASKFWVVVKLGGRIRHKEPRELGPR